MGNKFFKTSILTLFVLYLCSCAGAYQEHDLNRTDQDGYSSGNNNGDGGENVTPQQNVVDIVRSVSKEWGTSAEKIQLCMPDFVLIRDSDEDMLYSRKDVEVFVSYGLTERKLSAVLVLLPKAVAVNNVMTGILQGYEYLGELEETDVYVDSETNTLAILPTQEEDEETVSIGFAPIDSDLYPEIPALSVETGGAENTMPYGTILSGVVSGVSEPVATGFFIGRKPVLDEGNGRRIDCNVSDNQFSYRVKGLIDCTEYYYRAFAIIDDTYYYGDVCSFTTDELTYSFAGDDRVFKMIHITDSGLNPFAIMQTEVLPFTEMFINGTSVGVLVDSNKAVQVMVKASMNRFLDLLYAYTGLYFRQCSKTEWSYVASYGDYRYAGSNSLYEVGWYKDNSGGTPHNVALKSPNALDLFDLSGNYAEICPSSNFNPDNDKTEWLRWGTPDANKYGGSWNSSLSNCTVNSYEAGNSSNQKIEGTTITEGNAVSVKDATIRLAFSWKEE